MTDAESITVALAQAARPWYVPTSTYRLQFHAGFPFAAAAALVPYLHRLGVTTCYSSPYLMAKPGSQHGYDICDHSRLNPELGTGADYEAFVDALGAHGMGQTLDFVPNHMGIDPEMNPWWHDVLENGPSSAYARSFDIDWFPVKDELHVKVLLPILGDQYGLVLDRGELKLGFDNGSLVLHYWDQRLPVNPRHTAFQHVARLRDGLQFQRAAPDCSRHPVRPDQHGRAHLARRRPLARGDHHPRHRQGPRQHRIPLETHDFTRRIAISTRSGVAGA